MGSKPGTLVKFSSESVSLTTTEVHSEHFQTSKAELFPKIVNDGKPLTIFRKKNCIIDLWQDSRYAYRVLRTFKKIPTFPGFP